jgi:transcriptional regulator with XRE-family HTH domain
VFLRRVRERAGLTQVEFAELLGIRQSSISQWERGVARPDGAHQFDLLFKLTPASIAVLTDLAKRYAATDPAPPSSNPDSL